MKNLEEQAWKRYVETRKLSKEEQADKELCENLRTTTDYALCRLHVAWCNFGNAVIEGLR